MIRVGVVIITTVIVLVTEREVVIIIKFGFHFILQQVKYNVITTL